MRHWLLNIGVFLKIFDASHVLDCGVLKNSIHPAVTKGVLQWGRGVCFPGRPERSNKTPTDALPQISFSGSTDTRGQISEFPAEVTDIGNYHSFKP